MKKVITASNYEVIPLNLRTNVRFYTSVDFGSYVPPHWHDAIEILYLQEGELKVNTESTSRNLRSGQCTLIQPNKVHSTLCTRPNKAIVFQIPLLFLEKFVPDASRLTFQLEGTPRQASQPEWDRQKTQINQFKEISIKSRKDGLLALESDIEQIKDDFMKTGLELVVDGIEGDLIVEILNNNISEIEGRYSKGAKMYKTWGSYAPAFGMIGTLVGLIQMLAELDNPDNIASGMAAALITTFYGALLANLILNPLGFNLENKGQREVENREMMLIGILSIKNGDSTRVLEEKLKSFLNEKEKVKYEKESSKDS